MPSDSHVRPVYLDETPVSSGFGREARHQSKVRVPCSDVGHPPEDLGDFTIGETPVAKCGGNHLLLGRNTVPTERTGGDCPLSKDREGTGRRHCCQAAVKMRKKNG